MTSILDPDDRLPRYPHFLIFDAGRKSIGRNQQLMNNTALLLQYHRLFEDTNPCVWSSKMMHSVERYKNLQPAVNNIASRRASRHIHIGTKPDPRRYSGGKCNEILAFFITEYRVLNSHLRH